jgi:hypothetical protein
MSGDCLGSYECRVRFIELGTGDALHQPGKTLQFSFIHREFDMRKFHRTLLGTLFAALAFGASTAYADALEDISKAGVLKVSTRMSPEPAADSALSLGTTTVTCTLSGE